MTTNMSVQIPPQMLGANSNLSQHMQHLTPTTSSLSSPPPPPTTTTSTGANPLTSHQFSQQQNLLGPPSLQEHLVGQATYLAQRSSGHDANTRAELDCDISTGEMLQTNKGHDQQATICDQSAHSYVNDHLRQHQNPYSILINNKTIKGEFWMSFWFSRVH